MKCSNCGAELKPDAKFCDFCGTPVPVETISSATPAPEDYIPPAFPYADDPVKQAEPAAAEPTPVEPTAIDFTPKVTEAPLDFFPETPAAPTPSAIQDSRSGFAIASLVIGILSLCGFWFIPICGQILIVIGLIMGFMGLKSNQRGLAIAGIVLNFVVLCVSLVYLIFFGGSAILSLINGALPNQ
jgi:hypothetical protein